MREPIACAECAKPLGSVALPTAAEMRDRLKGDYSVMGMTLKSLLTSMPDVSAKAVTDFMRYLCPECTARGS